MLCPVCQTENAPTAKFCSECGTRLGGAKNFAPASPPASLESLITPSLAAKLEDARLNRTMQGERRIVTMLFSDVKGSTAAAGQVDPEEWAEIMNGAFEQMIRPIYRYEGTVARLMGDAILAFFGAPIAHEDDPQRAVLAGLEIVAGFGSYREKVSEKWKLEIDVRVGINTGLVMVGQVGSDLQMEYTALGDAINLAARMEQTAQFGTVQVSEDTHRLIAPLFEWVDLGKVAVKGKPEPVRAYRPLKQKENPGRLRGLEAHGIASPLVGRETEFQTAIQALDALRGNRGGVLLLLGEPGLGKSRLVAELKRSAFEDSQASMLWLEGRTLSFGQSISYWPFQEILRAHAGIGENEAEHEAWYKLESALAASCGPGSSEILPYLASLLALRLPPEYEERMMYLDAEALGRQVFLASRRYFEQLAAARPVVLIFEDIHWMDNSSARLLEHLIPLVDRVPILIVGVSRPDWQTPIAAIRQAAQTVSRHAEIQLQPLTGAESDLLVRNLLEIESLPGRVREMIIQKSDGNPFFIEEVIRTLISASAVEFVAESRQWRATTEIEAIHIPDTVQGVIMARIDRLDDDVKRVLRTAAVIGRSFLYRVLRAVEAASEALDEWLAILQAAELIREKKRDPELEFIFKHALAQEAAYENILLQTRRELHARVGEAIETLFSGRLEEFYGLLAYHYARAEDWQKAQEYLFKVGDQAGRVAADAEALAHYQQAMTAYERAFGDQWDPLQRAALERKIGEALFRRGEHEDARRHLFRGLELLGRPFPSGLSAVRAALIRAMLRQAGHRIVPWIFVRGPFRIEDGAAVREELRIYDSLIWIEVVNSPERFMLASLRALNQSERANILEGVSEGFSGLQVAFDFLGLYMLGGYYGRLALKTARKSADPNALALATQNICMHASWTGHGERAISFGEQSARRHRDSGNLRGWGAATMMTGETQIYLGRLEEARRQAERLIRDGQDGSDPQVEAWGYSIAGPAAQFNGDLPQAVEHFRRYYEISESIDDAISMMEATTQLAHCHVLMGDPDAAASALSRSEQIAIKHNVLGRRFVGRLHNVRAEVALLVGERESDKSHGEALRRAGAACKLARRTSRSYVPWLAWSYRLQGRYERARGDAGSARSWYSRSLAQAEKLGQTYEADVTRREMEQLS